MPDIWKENIIFLDLPNTNKDNSDISFVNGKTEDAEKKTVHQESSTKDPEDTRYPDGQTTNSRYTPVDGSPTSYTANNKFIPMVPEEMVENVRKDINSKSRELFTECQVEVKKFLSGAPFKEFKMSMYFHRYLQWKYLECQQVTYITFRMYRVLGE